MTAPAPEIVTMADVRRAGVCVRGARRWCEANGLNFREFAAKGVEAARILATGDPLAARMIDKMRAARYGR